MQLTKTKLNIIVFCLGLFSTKLCFSFMHFEPLAGYQFQTLKLVNVTNVSQEFKSDSPLLGAKFGFRTPFGVSLDVVGTYASGKTKTSPSLLENPDFTHTIGSFQLGVSAMNVMKLYLGTLFSTDYQIKENASVSDMKLTGTGYQAGMAFYISKSFMFTVNYNVHQLKKVSGSTFTTGDDVKTYFTTHDLSDVSTYLSYSF